MSAFRPNSMVSSNSAPCLSASLALPHLPLNPLRPDAHRPRYQNSLSCPRLGGPLFLPLGLSAAFVTLVVLSGAVSPGTLQGPAPRFPPQLPFPSQIPVLDPSLATPTPPTRLAECCRLGQPTMTQNPLAQRLP